MKQLFHILLLSVILSGCSNTSEVPERAYVKVKVSGLDFATNEPDSLKSASEDVFSAFEHNYAHCEIYMHQDQAGATIRSGNIGDGIKTFLVLGTWHVDGWGGSSSPLGLPELTFQIPTQNVTVTAGSDSIEVQADLDCALILVADPHDQIESAYMLGEGLQVVDFYTVDHFYYTYFMPQASYQALIIKKDSTELILNAGEFNTGTTTQVVITKD